MYSIAFLFNWIRLSITFLFNHSFSLCLVFSLSIRVWTHIIQVYRQNIYYYIAVRVTIIRKPVGRIFSIRPFIPDTFHVCLGQALSDRNENGKNRTLYALERCAHELNRETILLALCYYCWNMTNFVGGAGWLWVPGVESDIGDDEQEGKRVK
jgi:hypothetical protein